MHDGKEYDSKAILPVAHQYEYPGDGPLRYENDIYGGKGDAALVLKRLGFCVEYRPSASRGDRVR